MKTFLTALLFLVGASAAQAKDITITLNDQEQKVFLALLDVALKQGGLQSLQAVSQFVAKIQKEIQAAAPAAAPPALPVAPEAPKGSSPEKK